MNIIW